MIKDLRSVFVFLILLIFVAGLRSQEQVPTILELANGASYLPGPICPGEVVLIKGSGLGPRNLAQLRIDPTRPVSIVLADTRVLFDGVPAPLIYVSETRLAVVVPYATAMKSSSQVQVEYKGLRSSPYVISVAGSAPGIFSADGSGTGQGAVLNQDSTPNNSSKPANKGEVISLFATGAGQTVPPGEDGKLATGVLPKPLLPVTVLMGGDTAEVLNAGAAPNSVAGVLRVDVRIPMTAGAGWVPVVLTVGNASSQSGLWIYVPYGEGTPGMMQFLDNGVLRVGVDLNLGGTITYLSDSRTGENIVNNWDLGRQIQQSYYGGPQPFGKPHPLWTNWPWNPNAAGDSFGYRSRTLAYSNDSKTIYVKARPLIWSVENTPCECTIESWIDIEANTVKVRNRLRNDRSDKTQYPALYQETPGVYTNGKMYRILTYDGLAPFSNGPLREIRHVLTPDGYWKYWQATENWAALVDERGRGLGVYRPGVYGFAGGYSGTPNTGGSSDAPCGYLGPRIQETLDYNIVLDYDYYLILGAVDDIRSFVYAHRPAGTLPSFRFDQDRQHWSYYNVRDEGIPISDCLRLKFEVNDPQLFGPPGLWKAADVPRLYIRAAYRTKERNAEVFWIKAGENLGFFPPENRISFPIIPDGQVRTYEVDLSSMPTYNGHIARLRFDPVLWNAGPGESVDLYYVSHRKLEEDPPCSLQASPRNVAVSAAGSVGSTITVNANASGCRWTATANVPWILVSAGNSGVGNGTVVYTVGINTGPLRSGTITVAGHPIYVNQVGSGDSISSLATITSGGVVNAASYSPPIAPGSFVTIKGQNLADTTTTWASAMPDGRTLPTALGGVRVRINGKDCFVYFVSPTQVNVLTPPDTASGPVDVDVMTSHGTATATVSMAPLSPALFTYTVQGVTYAAALIASDYAYVGPVGAVPGVSSRPAKAGDYILLYANGLGPTMPAYPVGQILSGVYPIADLSQVRVLISGQPASVQFAGMTFAGVFQVNIQVPDGLPDGDLRVELQVAGQAPQGNVYIPVAR